MFCYFKLYLELVVKKLSGGARRAGQGGRVVTAFLRKIAYPQLKSHFVRLSLYHYLKLVLISFATPRCHPCYHLRWGLASVTRC